MSTVGVLLLGALRRLGEKAVTDRLAGFLPRRPCRPRLPRVLGLPAYEPPDPVHVSVRVGREETLCPR